MERDVWIASVSIDYVLFRAEALVPKYGGPERTNIAAGILRHGNADDLDLGGVWLDLQPPSLDRDPASQLNIALAQGTVLSGSRAHSHSLRPQVNVREVANGLGNLGDCRDEPGAMLERPDTEVGVCAREQNPPVLDSVSVVQGSSRRSLFVHPRNHRPRGPETPEPHGILPTGSIVLAMPDYVEVLSLAALVAATLEYAFVMRHREERRGAIRWQAELRESLVSLGRIEATPERRWTDEGSRLRKVP